MGALEPMCLACIIKDHAEILVQVSSCIYLFRKLDKLVYILQDLGMNKWLLELKLKTIETTIG